MIPVKNIYYMLSYAFRILQEKGYRNMETEEFENVADLCSAILIKAVSIQLKRGLYKEYMPETEQLSVPRGKINISESVRQFSMVNKKLVCSFDEFSENSYLNRIIKTTCMLLISSDIKKERKKALRKLMIHFSQTDTLEVSHINWNFRYNRSNLSYNMIISVCHLVITGLLQSSRDGTVKLMDYLDDQKMHKLYEKFILEYYRKHFPELLPSASQIPWALDNDENGLLPVMQTDITLRKENNILIIDAKYYYHNTQNQYNHYTVHSANLYQIFTYVKNCEAGFETEPHHVSGMLLYARTDDTIQPDQDYIMSGNTISVKTLNLSQDFEGICRELNTIIENTYHYCKKDYKMI